MDVALASYFCYYIAMPQNGCDMDVAQAICSSMNVTVT